MKNRESMPERDKINLVIVGDRMAEKTKFLISYVEGELPEDYVPALFPDQSVDVTTKDKTGHPKKIKICLRDTPGLEDFDSILKLMYSDTDVFLLAFSTVNPESFECLPEKWLHGIRQQCPKAKVLLLGLHKELRHDAETLEKLKGLKQAPVSVEQAKIFAAKHHCIGYVEASAKTGDNVNLVFDTVAKAFTASASKTPVTILEKVSIFAAENATRKAFPEEPEKTAEKKFCLIS